MMHDGFRSGGKTTRVEQGLTLVEVLVALLVLSIGLLGIAALQLTGLRENTSALRHSQATWIAYEMADRMRANRVGIETDAYDSVTTVGATSATCGSGASCSASDIATFDTFEWAQMVQQLPGGVGTVTDLGGERFAVRVMWDDRGDGVSGTGCDPTDATDMTCVNITVEP
jgi:type IV pilus assembly protein PilV